LGPDVGTSMRLGTEVIRHREVGLYFSVLARGARIQFVVFHLGMLCSGIKSSLSFSNHQTVAVLVGRNDLTRERKRISFGPFLMSAFWHLADIALMPTNVRIWG
jgi:hypothetical protein